MVLAGRESRRLGLGRVYHAGGESVAALAVSDAGAVAQRGNGSGIGGRAATVRRRKLTLQVDGETLSGSDASHIGAANMKASIKYPENVQVSRYKFGNGVIAYAYQIGAEVVASVNNRQIVLSTMAPAGYVHGGAWMLGTVSDIARGV